MTVGMEYRGRLGKTSVEPTDGKKKSVLDGDCSSSQVGAASSNRSADVDQSMSAQRNFINPLRTTSWSPCKMDLRKVHALFESLAYDPSEKSNTSIPSPSKSKQVVFDVSRNVDTYTQCSKCKNRNYFAYSIPCRAVSKEELETATDKFSLDNGITLHEDIFLFKGNLDGYPVYVHLKVSEPSFSSEVDILKYLKHPNVIALKAFCQELDHQALVFNFVCGRNLLFHLSSKNLNPVQWPKRANLAIELAKGLCYLHRLSIIHGNINSLNVHVTCDFVPVIGDFSFARSVTYMLHGRSDDKKARGYLAPEYQRQGEASDKQDVYAFGVILIELMTGLPPFSRNRSIPFLDEWGRMMITEVERDIKSLGARIVDPRLVMNRDSYESFFRMIVVATKCLQENPSTRPSMTEILQELEKCAVVGELSKQDTRSKSFTSPVLTGKPNRTTSS